MGSYSDYYFLILSLWYFIFDIWSIIMIFRYSRIYSSNDIKYFSFQWSMHAKAWFDYRQLMELVSFCLAIFLWHFQSSISIFRIKSLQVFSKSIYCVQKLNNCDKIVNVQYYNAVKCHTLLCFANVTPTSYSPFPLLGATFYDTKHKTLIW